MNNEPTERKKWFYKHAGKLVFRSLNGCRCIPCAEVYQDGLIILNKSHADYLYDSEIDFEQLGLTYFATREERDAFEEKQKTPAI